MQCFKYHNPITWQVHYNKTAEEIIQQTNGKVTHFVSGAATGGIFTGIVKRLKEYNPNIKAILIKLNKQYHGFQGLMNIQDKPMSGIFDNNLVDREVIVNVKDIKTMVKRLATPLKKDCWSVNKKGRTAQQG